MGFFFLGGGECRFYFYGREDFSDLGRTFTRLTRVSLVTRVSRRFFEGPFRTLFFLRESRVAQNPGDSPF